MEIGDCTNLLLVGQVNNLLLHNFGLVLGQEVQDWLRISCLSYERVLKK